MQRMCCSVNRDFCKSF